MKKHNFYAGPSILTPYTIQKTADAVINFADTGLSVLEVSHRSKEFQAVVDEAVALTKELLQLPEGYHVLFLGGGASMQFCMVPFNLLEKKAAYLNTGTWASNAIKEAKLFGEIDVVASSEDTKFNYIPKNFVIPTDADYFHYTSNNTIYGTELRKDPDSPVPMVCDMSSDIFSRVFDPTKYEVIYAGAQKNLAPAGVTIVIVPVANAVNYYTALQRKGVPASLHIFPTGGHGWGFGDWYEYKSQWLPVFRDFLTSFKTK